MKIYLIRKDNQVEEFNNVIEWDEKYCVYKAGKGICKIYAGEDEYFTDVEPKLEEE